MRPGQSLILFSLLTLWCCRPANQAGEGAVLGVSPERKGIISVNKQPEAASAFVLEWGKVKMPLSKYANPEVYSGMAEVELKDFRQLIGERLRLLHKGRELDVEFIGIYREESGRFSPYRRSYPGFEQGRLAEDVVSAFRQGIRPGDVVALWLSSPSGGIKVQPALIKVTDPFEPYSPAVEVPQPRFDGGVFGFQLIQEPGRRPLLRIDTTAESTRHIYEMYRHNRLYKIIHIPGFQTHQRLLAGRGQLFGPADIRRSALLGCGHDLLSLPEFTAFGGDEARLVWGDMLAEPSSGNYLLSEFLSNLRAPLHLMVGERELPIRSFHLITHGKTRQPALYVADSLQTPALIKALCRLQPASTVYFDKIVVEDEQERLLLFPQPFAFNIGAGPRPGQEKD